jgi:phosphatidate cytidylyltransferase
MSSLPRRLASSGLLVGLVLATLFWLPVWVFVVVVSAFALVSLYEFFTMVRHRGMLVHRPLSLTLGLVFLSLSAWRSLVEPGLVPTPILGPDTTVISWMWDIFWPATIVIIFVRQLTRENTFEALGGLATTLFGLAYIPALFGYLFYLRAMERGAWLVFFLILVTKMADAGAYLIGNLFGRHALIPRISPRKTVEGVLGAIVFGAVAAAAAAPVLQRPALTPGLALILGAFLGVVGQLGDLAESLLKRDCQVKDSGALIPGLGGVLDVIDSLLFTAPLFYGVLIYG